MGVSMAGVQVITTVIHVSLPSFCASLPKLKSLFLKKKKKVAYVYAIECYREQASDVRILILSVLLILTTTCRDRIDIPIYKSCPSRIRLHLRLLCNQPR